MRHTRKAFTIIELLIVIGIILLLISIFLAVIAKSRQYARLPGCMKNQTTLFNAIKMFAMSNNDACPGSCGPVSGGPGSTPYIGIGQLTSVTDSLPQTTLQLTSRSALLIRGYVATSDPFHCPQQDVELPFEMEIMNSMGQSGSANFQYVFNQVFVGDKKCDPAKMLPVYSNNLVLSPVTFARVGNPSRCVMITEDGLLTDITVQTVVGTTTYVHASPIHNVRANRPTVDKYTFTRADTVVCTYVDGHSEATLIETALLSPIAYMVPSDHSDRFGHPLIH